MCGNPSGMSAVKWSPTFAVLPTIYSGSRPTARKNSTSALRRTAEHWRVERMAAVDRNILRAGVAEFLGFAEYAQAGRD